MQSDGQPELGQTLEQRQQRDGDFDASELDNPELRQVEAKRGYPGEIAGQSYDPALDGPMAPDPPSANDGGTSWQEELMQETQQDNTPGWEVDPIWIQWLRDCADDGD